MRPNNSPWLHQLKRQRPVAPVIGDVSADVVIVGGGIAGLTTAYFTLKHTKHSVALIEGGMVAHGATGHNAGQMTSYFEKQIVNIAKDFGLDMVREAQAHIDSAWDLLEEICKDARLSTPYYRFTGYAGLCSKEEILLHLENNYILKDHPTLLEPLMIAPEAGFEVAELQKYVGLYDIVPHDDILETLETKNRTYIAALSAKKGVMNSALFTEELAGFLLSQYVDRFVLHEESFVEEVILEKDHAMLKVNHHDVKAGRVVLCTNGFEKFSIINHEGMDIDKRFHHSISGTIGYMAGYLDADGKPPVAISYIPNAGTGASGSYDSDPYFYMTRRPFETDLEVAHNLISVGGPDLPIEDTSVYSKDAHEYSEEAFADIDGFLHSTYKNAPKGEIPYAFHWHGLMGYTPNGVRLVGEEPLNRVLLYNLGCNGVGILPSIYGGSRIAHILNGEIVPPSIFDPRSAQ